MADPRATELRARALAIVRSGRLVVTDAVVFGDGRCVKFDAVVRPPTVSNQAYHPPRLVAWRPVGGWECDCGARGMCAHVAAAQLIAPTMPDPVESLGLGGSPDVVAGVA